MFQPYKHDVKTITLIHISRQKSMKLFKNNKPPKKQKKKKRRGLHMSHTPVVQILTHYDCEMLHVTSIPCSKQQQNIEFFFIIYYIALFIIIMHLL